MVGDRTSGARPGDCAEFTAMELTETSEAIAKTPMRAIFLSI
jgi:hypothetical protein